MTSPLPPPCYTQACTNSHGFNWNRVGTENGREGPIPPPPLILPPTIHNLQDVALETTRRPYEEDINEISSTYIEKWNQVMKESKNPVSLRVLYHISKYSGMNSEEFALFIHMFAPPEIVQSLLALRNNHPTLNIFQILSCLVNKLPLYSRVQDAQNRYKNYLSKLYSSSDFGLPQIPMTISIEEANRIFWDRVSKLKIWPYGDLVPSPPELLNLATFCRIYEQPVPFSYVTPDTLIYNFKDSITEISYSFIYMSLQLKSVVTSKDNPNYHQYHDTLGKEQFYTFIDTSTGICCSYTTKPYPCRNKFSRPSFSSSPPPLSSSRTLFDPLKERIRPIRNPFITTQDKP